MSIEATILELEELLLEAPRSQLLEVAARLRDAISVDADPDLYMMAEGVHAILLSTTDDSDREVLASQLANELEGIRLVASVSAPLAETPAPGRSWPPAWVDAAMLREFQDSQQGLLAEIEEILLDTTRASDGRRGQVAGLLHTLKGDAGTVALDDLEHLYHVLEDRLQGTPSLADATDDILAVKDWVLGTLPKLIAGGAESAGREALLATLRGRSSHTPRPVAPLPSTIRSVVPTDPEMIALFREFYDESTESLVEADDLLVGLETGPVRPEAVDTLFRIFHTIKGLSGFLEMGEIGAIGHRCESLLGAAREGTSSLTRARVELLLRATSTTRRLLDATRDVIGTGRPAADVPGLAQLYQALADELDGPQSAPAPAMATDEPVSDEVSTRSAPQDTIKVGLDRVDSLVETIGELVVMDAMVSNSTALASALPARARQQLTQLSKIVRDLQRQGLALRMVPLRGVFQKMNRLVRDLSRKTGKPLQLELAGQDAEMDRTLAERLGDPLVHMMRNAADHGVESVADRLAAGKPATATLRLAAYHEAGNIVVELSDDGRGLDRERVLRKARERGLVNGDATLSDSEVWDLIFLPGFSTAPAVTELSGRGVGLDVVKKTVDELRGRIQTSSEPGRGTTFKLVLPLTLAIIDGMVLAVGGRRYVLPTQAILESMQPEGRQIHSFGSGGRFLDIRGSQLRLVDLGRLLGVSSSASADPSSGFVVVVDGIAGRFAVLVDNLIGQQQVVIKQVDPALNRAGLFSGAAIMSDGQVGLILNPGALTLPLSVFENTEPMLEAG